MKMKKMYKQLSLAVVGALMSVGISSQALAAPTTQFTINPSALGGANVNKLVSYLQVAASELLIPDGFGGHTAAGVIGVTGLMPASGSLPVSGTGLGGAYNLYMTFDLADSATSDPTTFKMTKLNVKFWADLDTDTEVNNATGDGAVGGAASIGGITTDDKLLAVMDLVSGTGKLTPSPGGSGLGAELKATLNFALCTGAGVAKVGGDPSGTVATGTLAALANGSLTTGTGPAAGCVDGTGNSYFVAPRPFYDLAFTAFTNTGQNATPNQDGTITLTNTGQLDFGRTPEPGTLGLLGLGLFAIGAIAQRRKA